MKRLIQSLVALLLLWLVIRQVDTSQLAETFGRLRYLAVIEAVTLFFLSCALAVSKWRLLWRKATWWQMLNANFASQFYSLILPGQLAGEVVKTFRVGRRFSDTAGVAASVLVDRATGIAGLLILACGGAMLSASSVAERTVFPLVVITTVLLGGLYIVTLPAILSPLASIVAGIGAGYRLLRGLCGKAVDFLYAWASVVADSRKTLAAIALGVVYQFMAVCVTFVIANDLGVDVGFFDWCWVVGLVSVALMVPITFAGIGVREGVYAGSLNLLGVPIEKAVAVSFVVFAIALLGALIGAILELSSPPRTRERI